MTREGIKGYHVILTGAKKIPADDEDEIQEKEISELNLLNFTDYNELIITQEDTVCFQIIKEARKEANEYGYAILV